jgi:hypothetical protein
MVQRESATVVDHVYNTTRRPPLNSTVRKTGPNATQVPRNVPLAKPEVDPKPQDDDFIMPVNDSAPTLGDTNSISRRFRNQANAKIDHFLTWFYD